jgi:hypothetical protein
MTKDEWILSATIILGTPVEQAVPESNPTTLTAGIWAVDLNSWNDI